MDLHDKFLLWRSPTETQEDIPHLRCTGRCLCFFLLEVRNVLFLTLSCYVLIEFRIGIYHYSSPFVRRNFCFRFNKATRGWNVFRPPFHVSCCFLLMEEFFSFPSKVKMSTLFVHAWLALNNLMCIFMVRLTAQVVYLALTHFWIVAVESAPVWFELEMLHFMRNLTRMWPDKFWFENCWSRRPHGGSWTKMAGVEPAKFGQSVFPWLFFNISYLCCWIHKGKFLENRTMKEFWNQTLLSPLVVLYALKKKVLELFLKKKLVVPNIRSSLRTQLNQNMKYEVTTSETIIVRYISSVFVALSVGKTSPVGEIWVEIHMTHIFSSAETKIAHEWVPLIVWFIITELLFLTPCPWFAAFHCLLTQRNDAGWVGPNASHTIVPVKNVRHWQFSFWIKSRIRLFIESKINCFNVLWANRK